MVARVNRKALGYEAVAFVLLMLLAAFVRERIAGDGWRFAGSDTYGYLRLADEWRTHGRYALGPHDPLHFGRMPGYPLFLIAVKGAARADMSGGDGWGRILLATRLLDLFVCCPLIYLIARRLGGVGAALGALAIAAVWPMTVLFTAVALTESPATSLTVITVAPLLLGESRPRLRFAAAGALVGASTLLRFDGILLAFAVPPALCIQRERLGRSRRELITIAAFSVLGFLVVFSPWPIRNLYRSGKPSFFGQRVDRFCRPLDYYQGFWSYLKTWAPDNYNQMTISTCFLTVPCRPDLSIYPPMAFDSPEERATVEKLMAQRVREGVSPGVSVGFQKLADVRRAHHWLRTVIGHPLLRAARMWVARHDEVLQGRQPWPQVIGRIKPAFLPLSAIFFIALLASGTWLVWLRETRYAALTMMVPLVVRTIALPYELYSMPRYANEVMPFGFILIAVASAKLVALARRRSASVVAHPTRS
jgi:4-amino-4-deoxy-L-arabinose transferase-like glycosyltransferase